MHKGIATEYTRGVPPPADTPTDQPGPPSLRAEQVAQTRAALVAAGRRLFGQQGFAATSVDDLAREARVTTGALYHHFPNKTKLFEAVFELAHTELMEGSVQAATGAPDEVELLSRGFEAFLDSVQQPELRQIVIVDAPAVLGLARFTELDEQYAYTEIMYALQSAIDAGRLEVEDPGTLTRLLLGALTRGAMLVANSEDPERTRGSVARTMRALLTSFVP
ncbi:MAG: TetR/AcrR family transcriptional regulator [Actinobacteria bacterium]|nr:TetR/AcrR family transcriptional regulator [Actinomycetota bacterium]